MPTLTTKVTRLTNICQGARRARRQVHRRDDRGCRSDITRRGEVGIGETARGVIVVVITDARCVCPAPRRHAASAATAARGGAVGGTAPRATTSDAIAAASEPPPGGLACSLRTHAPVRGAFSRRGGYVCVTRAAAAIMASSDSESPRRFPPRQNGPLVWLGVFACDRVMPRALWCGLGRRTLCVVLLCCRHGGGCGQRRTQRRLSKIIEDYPLLFGPGSSESPPRRIFLSGLYIPHSQWG